MDADERRWKSSIALPETFGSLGARFLCFGSCLCGHRFRCARPHSPFFIRVHLRSSVADPPASSRMLTSPRTRSRTGWTLATPVSAIRGVGPHMAGALEQMGLRTLSDLIRHLPAPARGRARDGDDRVAGRRARGRGRLGRGRDRRVPQRRLRAEGPLRGDAVGLHRHDQAHLVQRGVDAGQAAGRHARPRAGEDQAVRAVPADDRPEVGDAVGRWRGGGRRAGESADRGGQRPFLTTVRGFRRRRGSAAPTGVPGDRAGALRPPRLARRAGASTRWSSRSRTRSRRRSSSTTGCRASPRRTGGSTPPPTATRSPAPAAGWPSTSCSCSSSASR